MKNWIKYGIVGCIIYSLFHNWDEEITYIEPQPERITYIEPPPERIVPKEHWDTPNFSIFSIFSLFIFLIIPSIALCFFLPPVWKAGFYCFYAILILGILPHCLTKHPWLTLATTIFAAIVAVH